MDAKETIEKTTRPPMRRPEPTRTSSEQDMNFHVKLGPSPAWTREDR